MEKNGIIDMDVNELLNMKLKDILEQYIAVHNDECDYYYGIASFEDMEKLYKKYNINEEYPDAFSPSLIVSKELEIYSRKPVLTYEKLEKIMKNLGISKKDTEGDN